MIVQLQGHEQETECNYKWVASAGVNTGFRVVDNGISTYSQTRHAFTYFYPKRKVLSDNVSTTYLDI